MAIINLGDSGFFAVLAGTTVTNTGNTVIDGGVNGNVGVSPGASVTGFPPGVVTPPGTIHLADVLAGSAQTDLTAAYNQAAALPFTTDLTGDVLGSGGTVPILAPGVYLFTGSAQLSGALTLSGVGDYVFQIATTLITDPGSSIVLSTGATADRVFWQVGSSATLDTGTAFEGTILALTSITINTGANVNGKALARNGAVTLDTNNIIGDTSALPIAASIDLNWISNYAAGCHRVCYSQDEPLGPFTCVIVNCTPGVGQPCSTSIPITVDNESCNQVTYYGYIQACCEDISSTNGRIPWQVTFIPNPDCLSVNFLCNDTSVTAVNVAVVGSGYNPGSPPLVSIIGGGGAGATAVAVVGNGGIESSVISNAGAGMTNGTYPGTAANAITGVGVGALYTVIVAGGIITSAVVTFPGSGYAIGDTVNFPAIPGSATEVITVNTVNTSKIQSITVTAGGSGYSSLPSAIIAPSPGFGGFPQIDAVLGPVEVTDCAGFNTGDTCANSDAGSTTSITVGKNFDICYPGGLSGVPVTVPATYAQSESGLCCFDCLSVLVIQPKNAGATTFFYQDCATGTIIQAALGDDTQTIVCAKRNSLASMSALTTFTPGASCP